MEMTEMEQIIKMDIGAETMRLLLANFMMAVRIKI
jgi:hypothetical protein